MTSKFKGLTVSIPPSSSEGNTADLALPSEPSATADNMLQPTQTMPKSSQPTKSADNTGERIRQQADLLRVTVRLLERRGLLKRYKVLSKDGTTVKEIRLVLSPAVWDESLNLRLLSDGVTTVAEATTE
jgi:hypothetical protein